MLKMNRVSKIYRTDTVETHALREFSLEVEEGEFVSVTGAVRLRQNDVSEYCGTT